MTRPCETASAEVPVHEPPTTKEGWTAFIQQQPSRVDLLSAQQIEALTPAGRDAYDEERVAHHARLVVVATPTVDQIVKTGRRLVVLNGGTDTARRGLVVTGDSGTGKSTAIKQLGKHHELLTRRRRGTTAPLMLVVYLTVPPAATPKILAAEFARFIGLPLPHSLNQVDITSAVCEVLCRLGTELVLVDEIHNLNLATRGGAESSDQLNTWRSGFPPRSSTPASTSSTPACSPGCAAGRSPAGSPPSPRHRLRSAPAPNAINGLRSSALWRTLCACTITGPDPCAPRQLSAHTHQRHDRQPVPPHPRRGDRGDLRQHRTNHQEHPGQRDPRPRRRASADQDTTSSDPVPPVRLPDRQRLRLTVTSNPLDPHRYWRRTLRPLPIPLPPMPGEIMASYVRRLADTNMVDRALLLRHIGRHYNEEVLQLTSYDLALNPAALTRLAVLGGYPKSTLLKAIPAHISDKPGPDPIRDWIPITRPKDPTLVNACSRCAARRGVHMPVVIRLPDKLHPQICVQHQRALAPYHDRDRGEQSLVATPEITAAGRRYHTLRRRHRFMLQTAFANAENIINSGHQLAGRTNDPEKILARWQTRQAHLLDASDRVIRYPEIIALTSLFAATPSPLQTLNKVPGAPSPLQFVLAAVRCLDHPAPHQALRRSHPLFRWARVPDASKWWWRASAREPDRTIYRILLWGRQRAGQSAMSAVHRCPRRRRRAHPRRGTGHCRSNRVGEDVRGPERLTLRASTH